MQINILVQCKRVLISPYAFKTVFIWLIDYSHPSGYGLSLWFWFAYPGWLVILSNMSCGYCSYLHHLWWNIVSMQIFYINFGLSFIIKTFLYYSVLYHYMISKYFLSICEGFFYFIGNVLWNTKVLNFYETTSTHPSIHLYICITSWCHI